MKFEIPDLISFDASFLYGQSWNISKDDLITEKEALKRAAESLSSIRRYGKGPEGQEVLFPHLPYLLDEGLLMPEEEKRKLDDFLSRMKGNLDILISAGIGGSYLGNQMLFDLFCGPYWNLSSSKRHGFPEVFFAGHNEDPDSILGLISYIREKEEETGRKPRVLVLAISKSGTTIEPMHAVYALYNGLKDICHLEIAAITDKKQGRLFEMAERNHWTRFTVPEGIGGRFSVLSQVGFVFGKLCGIDMESMLRGAKAVEEAMQSEKPDKNPAMALAAMKYIATTKYGITSEIIMPYGLNLRSFGWWYAQLFAESLGKRKDLSGNTVHYGRTLVPCVGTTDMHSMTQEHQEGKANKLVQFVTVENTSYLKVMSEENDETGMVEMGRVLEAARKSNAEAMGKEHRMSAVISIPALTPYYIGALIYFCMLAVAYEGAMADINAFDQPGVEAYKKILHSYIRGFIKEGKKADTVQ